MKHIVMFSGGAASAFVGKIVTSMYGKEDTILLHTPTYSEHEDADRFREQASNRIGLKMTEQADGRDIWQLIEDQHCLPSQFIPFCTRILKIEQTDKFLKTLDEDYTLHYGYGPDEWRRIQKQTARFETRGIKTKYPLAELNISNETVKSIIRDTWGICLPEPYKYLKHNNCIPCFKGGKNHFRAVAKYYPDRFKKAIDAEKFTGHTVFKDCTLEDIWEEVQAGKLQVEFDGMDEVPCMCSF